MKADATTRSASALNRSGGSIDGSGRSALIDMESPLGAR